MMPQAKKPTVTGINHNISLFSIRRALCLFLALLLPPLGLSGCAGRQEVTAAQVLAEIRQDSKDAPAGEVYLLAHSLSLRESEADAQESPRYRVADEALLDALFGSSENPSETKEIWQLLPDLVDDGAMALSLDDSPDRAYEVLVFRCVDRTGTDEVAALMLRRLELLRRQYRESEGQTVAEQGQVLVIGRFVILVVGVDAEEAKERAREIIY